MANTILSLIVPVYNEEEVLRTSYERMRRVMENTGLGYEMIFVNDGSRDGTMGILRAIAAEDTNVRVFSFSRNFGHQLAVTCGMDHAAGDALIIIDADLQDPPELIPAMIEKWRGGADIVYGKRLKREGESFMKKFTAAVYYRLLDWMSAYPIPLDTGDFRLLDRKVADVFLRMREHDRYLRGMSAWMGFNAVPVEYRRDERAAGKTKYTLKKMLKLAMDGITGFSDKPLVLPGYLGIALSVIAVLGFIALIIVRCAAGSLPAWLWAVAGLVLINGLTLCCMGLWGLYLGRMYTELKDRPLYLVCEELGAKRD